MAWTTPSSHIWATAEVLTASNMNTYIEANLQYLGQGWGAYMYQASLQSLPAGAFTVVSFDTDANDPNGITTTGSGAKMTIPTGAAGVYICSWNVSFANTTSDGDRLASALYRNSAEQARGADETCGVASVQSSRPGTIVLPLAVNDVVQVEAFNGHASAVNSTPGEQYTWFAIHMVGPL